MLLGETPSPVQAPAQIVFDEVTKGYDPKSMSNKDPLAPSAKIFFPSFNAWKKVFGIRIELLEFCPATVR